MPAIRHHCRSRRPDTRPTRFAMALHVVVSDAIGDALIAQSLDQPVKQSTGVVPLDGGGQTVLAAAVVPSENFRIACQAADPMHEIEGVVAVRGSKLFVRCRCHGNGRVLAHQISETSLR
jgi:hypothetical protein